MSLTKRVKELRSQGRSFNYILTVCEEEGLLKPNEITLPTLRRRFYEAYPKEKLMYRDRGVLPIKPEYKEEVKAVFIRQLKDMGFTDKELLNELNRLFK
jgi:hypothetical protein